MNLFPIKYVIVVGLFFSMVFIARAQESEQPHSDTQHFYTEVSNPLLIPVMRSMHFPGSEIVIERVLPEGEDYYRYNTSYYSDGNKIHALLTIPKSKPPQSGYPAIVFAHGYIPPKEYRTDTEYYEYLDILARNGYVVMSPDLRGHGESQGEANGAYFSPSYTVDFLNAIESLKVYKGINPQKIGVWGHSMGGHILLRSMSVSDSIAVAVIWSGVIGEYEDILYSWKSPEDWITTQTEGSIAPSAIIDTYGSLHQNPSFWNAISPLHYLHDVNIPLQIHHGERDSVVPIEFAKTFYAQHESDFDTIELYTYSEGQHMFSGDTLDDAGTHTLRFFNMYLKD